MMKADRSVKVWIIKHDGRMVVNGHNAGLYKSRRSAMLACERLITKGVNVVVVSCAMPDAAQNGEAV